MKISYYLNNERKKNLYCRISDGNARITFSLGHNVSPGTWDNRKEDVKWEDQYGGTLVALKKVLNEKYRTINNEDKNIKVEILKNEALNFVRKDGLEGLQKTLWNNNIAGEGIGNYDDFITAIEKHSGLTRHELKIFPEGYSMTYVTPDNLYYEVDTYNGHSEFINAIIESRDYDSIYTMTWSQLWNEVYISDVIVKAEFLPQFLKNWESYWDEQKKSMIPNETHNLRLKQKSWNQFIVFMSCYDSSNPFELANELDDLEFGTLFIITMLDIFDKKICIDEYCDYYFNSHIWEWNYLDLSNGNEDKEKQLSESSFYFRKVER